jgi:hypothetical protein
MQNIKSRSLFDFRFRLRTLLYAVTVVCLFLALCPLIATESGFTALMFAFMAFCLGLTVFAVWLATRTTPQFLGILIVCHLAIAMFLLIPIVSYHVNGRAWYDYGLSTWNPPPFHFSDGTIGISDYDPKFTQPAVWPFIGPVMYVLCWLSIELLIFPPAAPIVSIALPILAIRLRHVLTTWQSLCVWASWAIGLVPVLYLVLWGGKVFEWIAD